MKVKSAVPAQSNSVDNQQSASRVTLHTAEEYYTYMDRFPKGNRDAEDYQSHYQNSNGEKILLGDGSARTILFQSADQGIKESIWTTWDIQIRTARESVITL